MADPTDEELLVTMDAGPPEALVEFYQRHVGRVVGFGARRFRDPEDVADFVADVFVEVLSTSSRFDPHRGSAVAWLYGVAANVAAARRRRAARRLDAEKAVSGRRLLDADDYGRLEERIDAAARARRVCDAMASLPEAERRIAELVLLDELSPAEAASTLHIRPVAARVRLSRARRKLQHVLDDAPLVPAGLTGHAQEEQR